MRKKGMISREVFETELDAFFAQFYSMATELEGLLPLEWQSWEDVLGVLYEVEGYSRESVTPPGFPGTSQRTVEIPGGGAFGFTLVEEWFIAVTDRQSAANLFLTHLLATLSVSLPDLNGGFRSFGHGFKGFDREDWKAGSVEMDEMKGALMGWSYELRSKLTALQGLIGSGWSELTYVSARDFEWSCNIGGTEFPQVTSEPQVWRTQDYPDDPPVSLYFPHVGAGGPDDNIWDRDALEQNHKRALAAAIIAELRAPQWRGDDLRSFLGSKVRLWRTGSQTASRGR